MLGSQTKSCHSQSSLESRAVVFIQRCIEHLQCKEARSDRTRTYRAMKGGPACEGRGRGIVSTQHISTTSGAELIEAERELAAFYAAVSNAYGPESAQIAAEEWIRELEKRPVGEAIPSLRRTTIAASAALASRVVIKAM